MSTGGQEHTEKARGMFGACLWGCEGWGKVQPGWDAAFLPFNPDAWMSLQPRKQEGIALPRSSKGPSQGEV